MKCHATLFCVLALYLHQGQAIKCHSCNSFVNETCVDPIGSSLKTIKCTPELFSQDGTIEHELQTFLVRFNIRINFTKGMECGRFKVEDGGKAVVARFCSPRWDDKDNRLCALITKTSETNFTSCAVA